MDAPPYRVVREMKDKVFRGFPQEKVAFDAWKSRRAAGPAATLIPSTSSSPLSRASGSTVSYSSRATASRHIAALIYVKSADDVIYPVDYDPLLPAFTAHVILVLHRGR